MLAIIILVLLSQMASKKWPNIKKGKRAQQALLMPVVGNLLLIIVILILKIYRAGNLVLVVDLVSIKMIIIAGQIYLEKLAALWVPLNPQNLLLILLGAILRIIVMNIIVVVAVFLWQSLLKGNKNRAIQVYLTPVKVAEAASE
jgi:hypothetical protein